MKNTLTTAALILSGLSAHAAIYSASVDMDIPDNKTTGIASTINVSDSMVLGPGKYLQVNLNITGTWNGDLYATLSHNGKLAVLLNRPGSTSTDGAGYDDAGLNVTLQDNAASGDIHWRPNPDQPLSGPLTGIWAPDGRKNDDPRLTTGLEDRNALLSVFDGKDIKGDWTLFVADLSSGEQSRLVNWSLSVAAVPEPSTYLTGLSALGMLGMFVFKGRRM